jgi:hypothetical protein
MQKEERKKRRERERERMWPLGGAGAMATASYGACGIWRALPPLPFAFLGVAVAVAGKPTRAANPGRQPTLQTK